MKVVKDFTAMYNILMVDKETLTLCEKLIKHELGSLDWLPRELANTVANQYYRFIELAGESVEVKDTEELSVECLKQGLLTVSGECAPVDGQLAPKLAKAVAKVEAIPEFLNVLHSVDNNKEPNEYRTVYELIIDYLKYEIDEAEKKLLVRRLAQRLTKKPDKEIPNLIDMIDV